MPLLVRKINKAKWVKTDIASGVPVCADAITNCLKTTNNTLSVWEIDDISKIDEAALAIVGSHTSLDTIDLVAVDEAFIKEEGICIEEIAGLTAIDELKNSHRDLSDLNYKDLGLISSQVVSAITNDKVYRYTKGALKKLLNTAIIKNMVKKEDLPSSIQLKL